MVYRGLYWDHPTCGNYHTGLCGAIHNSSIQTKIRGLPQDHDVDSCSRGQEDTKKQGDQDQLGPDKCWMIAKAKVALFTQRMLWAFLSGHLNRDHLDLSINLFPQISSSAKLLVCRFCPCNHQKASPEIPPSSLLVQKLRLFKSPPIRRGRASSRHKLLDGLLWAMAGKASAEKSSSGSDDNTTSPWILNGAASSTHSGPNGQGGFGPAQLLQTSEAS